MKIFTPQVHLKKENASGVFHIHVVTWMDKTKYKADGYNTLPTSAQNGVFTITLKIAEDAAVPNMTLLTPVVHTLTLTNISLSTEAPFIEVNVINSGNSSFIGKRKVHKDDADDSAMPHP